MTETSRPRWTARAPGATTRAVLLAGLMAGAFACTGQIGSAEVRDGGGDGGAPPAAGALVVQPVAWNASMTPTGHVAAVAEDGAALVLFSDSGAMAFAGGSPTAVDPTVTAWRSAAAIPAADSAGGTWVVGVDGHGAVYRLRAEMTLEPVSARYGLDPPAAVQSVLAAGPGRVAFVLEDGSLAVADGMRVGRYDGHFAGAAAGGGRIAAVTPEGAVVFDARTEQLTRYSLAEVTAVAVDLAGAVFVATRHDVYVEQSSGHLVRRATFPDTEVTALAAAGTDRVWIALGAELGLIDGMTARRTAAPVILPGARLIGSASGDLWVLSDGTLTRLSAGSGSGDEDQWRRDILPVFTRVCAQCHLPGGSAMIDLSTYATWSARRPLIGQRVIDRMPSPMPPAGATATPTAEELDAIRAWVARGM